MEARFIGDPRLGGDGPASITVRGLTFVKGGVFVKVGEDTRFAGNDHFQTRAGPLDHDANGRNGGSAPKTDAELTEKDRRQALFAALKALGLTFAKNTKTDALEAALAKVKQPVAVVDTEEDPQRAELIAQLEGLEVEFDREASTEALEAALDAATAPSED